MIPSEDPREKAPIIVVGSINRDIFLMVEELPHLGETVLATEMIEGLGGKGANQAVAAAKLGAEVHFVGAVGADESGRLAASQIARRGMTSVRLQEVANEATGVAVISVSRQGNNSIIVHPGANIRLDAERLEAEIRRVVDASTSKPIVVMQGEVAPAAIDRCAEVCEALGLRFVLNLAPVVDVNPRTLAAADPLVLNEVELDALGQRLGLDRDLSIDDLIDEVAATCKELVVTLGADGAVIRGSEGSLRVSTPFDVTAVDTTGAGDAFVGALVVGLATAESLASAVRWGVVCGTYSVTARGTTESYPTWGELNDAYQRGLGGAKI